MSFITSAPRARTKHKGKEEEARKDKLGDESTKRKRKSSRKRRRRRRRRWRRRRRTRVSQAVITDIGSAIVGATKAHGPEASQENDCERTEERWQTRGREKDIERGQR